MHFSIKKLRKDALSIFHHALQAADPFKAVMSATKLKGNILLAGRHHYHLKDFQRIFVIGAGKGCARMAQAIEQIFGDRITDGLIAVRYGYSAPLKKIKIHEAGHPIPDIRGLEAAQKIVRLLNRTEEDDLIIVLLSGGASALLPSLREGITLQDKQKLTDILLRCGATIREINTVRKHLSGLKGGGIARLAYPSTVISLILSDIIGDPIDSIASGPTAPDTTTFQDCIGILKKYDLMKKVPSRIVGFLDKGMRGQARETPGDDDPAFLKTQNLIVGNNFTSLQAAEKKANELGYCSRVLSTATEGEAREVAKAHAAILKKILRSGNRVKSPACVISGGETTVRVKGKGLGGRNQEFVLVSAIEIDGLENAVVLSAGTDGTDGPTDAAGALADSHTVSRAQELTMDAQRYLDNNDSYHFFKLLNDLIITGPTNTNVMDIRIMLASRPHK